MGRVHAILKRNSTGQRIFMYGEVVLLSVTWRQHGRLNGLARVIHEPFSVVTPVDTLEQSETRPLVPVLIDR